MEAVVSNFRRGRHVTRSNQMILCVDGVNSKEKAQKLVGKDVLWMSPAKKEIKGKIEAIHGNGGCVRAKFERGMPGQSIGKKLKIL